MAVANLNFPLSCFLWIKKKALEFYFYKSMDLRSSAGCVPSPFAQAYGWPADGGCDCHRWSDALQSSIPFCGGPSWTNLEPGLYFRGRGCGSPLTFSAGHG